MKSKPAPKTCAAENFFVTLQQYIAAEPDMGERRVLQTYKKRLSRLFLATQNLATSITVKDIATIGAFRV